MDTESPTPARRDVSPTHPPPTPSSGPGNAGGLHRGGDEGHHVPSGNRGGHAGPRGAKPQWGAHLNGHARVCRKASATRKSKPRYVAPQAFGRPRPMDQSPVTGEGPPTVSGGLPEMLRATRRASCLCRPGCVPGVNGSKGTDLAWVLGASRELPFSESLPTPLGDVVPWVICTSGLGEATDSGSLIRRKCPPPWTPVVSAEPPRPNRVTDAHALTHPRDDRVGRLP